MSTPDYFIQPAFDHMSDISSYRIGVANRALSAFPNRDPSQIQRFASTHRHDILKAFLSYLKSLHAGFGSVHGGTYTFSICPDSKDKYVDASAVLGFEATSNKFPVQLDNYSKTIERIIAGENCSATEINALESFVSRLTKKTNGAEPAEHRH